MKTANELAIEYWNKPPIERMHTTLQDYVYDYMNNQNERLRAQAIADAVEIARLRGGFEDIKSHCELSLFIEENYDGFNKAHNQALRGVLKEINRITGVEE